MEATTLTLYVGLTPSDATKLFDQRLPVAPHWADRWGLKTTPKQARSIFLNCSSCVLKNAALRWPGHLQVPQHR